MDGELDDAKTQIAVLKIWGAQTAGKAVRKKGIAP